jgi:hypothetical protein
MRHFLLPALVLAGCSAGPLPSEVRPIPLKPQCPDPGVLAPTHRALLGTWKHVELIRVIDGQRLSPQAISANSVLHFHCNGTWDSRATNYHASGTFRWVADDLIEQTIVESNVAVQVGLVNAKKIKVDEGRLEMHIEQTAEMKAQVMPPPKAGVWRENVTLVITRFDRVKQGE